MCSIGKFFKDVKHDLKRKRMESFKETLHNKFQVREHCGELWITFNGELVVACNMLVMPPLEALEAIRNKYIEAVIKKSILPQ